MVNLVYGLPNDIQWIINKLVFSETVLPCFRHKDWWWHTVKARSESWEKYIDVEIYGY
jgi:hypothetical protein